MEKTKLKDKKTGAVILVNKDIASDYIGTGDFEVYKEKSNKSFFETKKQEIKNDKN